MKWKIALKASRINVILSGGFGLVAGLVLMIICVVLNQVWFFKYALSIWLIGIMFFACFIMSLLEIPLMIYALRHMAKAEKSSVQNTMIILNGIFVFFAMVYAVPNLLFTHADVYWFGAVLASLILLRFMASVIFLAGKKTDESTN